MNSEKTENTALPVRLEQAMILRQQLASLGIYFAPVRHHSPACAYALQTQLQVLKPNVVLIEAPSSCMGLLDALLDKRCKPPIAMLCQATVMDTTHLAATSTQTTETSNTENTDDAPTESTLHTRAAFFPFCEYSPEWVALQTGQQLGAILGFIDLPWQQQIQHEIDSQINQLNTEIEEESNPDSYNDNQNKPQHKPPSLTARTLQAERYLAHSAYINALAKKAHCRDHDELWEHLFELRSQQNLANWQDFFNDTFVWSSMARLDYEPSVLVAESSEIREAHMVEKILEYYQQYVSKITKDEQPNNMVIVTGAFHTLALIETLAQTLLPNHNAVTEKSNVPTASPKIKNSHVAKRKKSNAEDDEKAWLIRYSFDRLDALNGYASGMPSPAYYQWVWQALQHTENHTDNISHYNNLTIINHRNQVAMRLLSQLAAKTRSEQLTDAVSFASVQNAALQAHLLADLRQHSVLGRYDLLDAINSCYIKGSSDDGQNAFITLLNHLLSGNTLGDVPPTTIAPPLVENTRRLALRHRLKLDDTINRRARLDVYRKPNHRERSRFLHLMQFLSCEFCKHVAGPDYITGTQLELLFEEWDYAWTPSVEARLIELSSQGSQLLDIALLKILQQAQQLEAQGQGRNAKQAVMLLTQAAVIGLQQQLPHLLQVLSTHVQEDSQLDSVVFSGLQLLHLWRGREFLGLLGRTQNQRTVKSIPKKTEVTAIDNPAEIQLLQLINLIVPTALFLLPRLLQVDENDAKNTVGTLLDLREFCHLSQYLPNLMAHKGNDFTAQKASFLQALLHLVDTVQDNTEIKLPALLQGAIDAILFIDGVYDERKLEASIAQNFGIGADPKTAVQYLAGLMQAAPELLVQTTGLANALNHLLQHWTEATFVAHLPDLRLAFTHLKPQETANLAEKVAALNGISAQGLHSCNSDISSADLQQGIALQLALLESLQADGLENWI